MQNVTGAACNHAVHWLLTDLQHQQVAFPVAWAADRRRTANDSSSLCVKVVAYVKIAFLRSNISKSQAISAGFVEGLSLVWLILGLLGGVSVMWSWFSWEFIHLFSFNKEIKDTIEQ